MQGWRTAIRLTPRIELPDTIRAIGVSACAAQDGRLEHEALNLLTARLQNAFVADLSDKDRHFGACRK